MKHLDIQEAHSSLVALLDEVTTTQTEIVIVRNGTPVARIIPYKLNYSSKQNYPLRAMPIMIAADFDEPMPEMWQALGA